MPRLATTLWSATGLLLLYIAVQLIQQRILLPLQTALLPQVSFLLAIPAHGLRVLCAWYFGWWSVIVLLPATIYIYLKLSQQFGLEYLTLGIHLVSATYLLSAPAAFWLLRLALGPQGHPKELEWRMIMLAGSISALLNVLALGLNNPPDLAARETLVWLVVRAFSCVAGLFVTLLAVLAMLRLVGRRVERIHSGARSSH